MLGTYSTRSATTNPTGKKRFDAGINGNAIKESAIRTVLEESPGYLRLNIPKAPRKQKKAKVARFRTSRNDSISGIVPMVQSQQSSEGFNRSQAFTGRR